MVLIQTPVKMQTHKPMQTPMLQRKQNPCFKIVLTMLKQL